MRDKIILYLGGGAMSGIFGAGVLTFLQEINVYDNIEAIYAVSVGVINASYFLTKQSKLGSSIYFEDLTENFIFPKNIPYGSLQRVWNSYVHRLSDEKIINAIDIDYLFNIIQNKKSLDVQGLKNQKIPFFAKLLNLDIGKIEYFDVRKENVFKILRASVSVIPYWFSSEEINNFKYVDGNIKEAIGLDYLLKKYPNHKIVIVLNFINERGIKHYFVNLSEAFIAKSINKNLFQFIRNKENQFKKDIDLAKKNDRVLLITPSENNPKSVRETNPPKLLKTYKDGKNKAKLIQKFLNMSSELH